MSLIDEEPRSAAAVAAEDTLLLILTQESFAQILHTYHALGVKLLMKITRMVSQRLRSTSGNRSRPSTREFRRLKRSHFRNDL